MCLDGSQQGSTSTLLFWQKEIETSIHEQYKQLQSAFSQIDHCELGAQSE